jgi:hypothetical protein
MTADRQEDRFPEITPWIFRNLWLGHSFGHIGSIQEHMQGILSSAGLPTEGHRPKPGKMLARPELDETAIEQGHPVHSKVWHAARIIQMITYLHVALEKVEGGQVPSKNTRVVDSAVELGIRIGLYELVVGYGSDIEYGQRHKTGLSKARSSSKKLRREKREKKLSEVIAAATEIWKKTPYLSASVVAESVAKKLDGSGSPQTIRKLIAGSRPRPVREHR